MEKNAVRDRFIEVTGKLHLTNYAISAAIGVSQGALSNFKRGKTNSLKFTTLSSFCEKYDVSINWLMYGKGEMLKIVNKEHDVKNKCKECSDKDRQIHHLTMLLDTYEKKINGYRDECAKLREEFEKFKESVKSA